MGLKELIKDEDNKYISVHSFIELVANHTGDTLNEVIDYIGRYYGITNYDVDIYMKGGFSGYYSEFHLSDLFIKQDYIDDYRLYKIDELRKDDEFIKSYFLKDDIFNAKYIKVLNLKPDQEKPQITNNYKVKTPAPTGIELGEYQRLLTTYSLFTPRHLACLIADYNPAYHHNDDFYNACLDMVNNAIEAKVLTHINDKEQVAAEQVKAWLAGCGFIYQGFNDNLTNDTSKTEQSNQQLTDAQDKIADLENQLLKFQKAAPKVVNIPFGKCLDFISKDLPQNERIKRSYELCSDNTSFYEDTHPVNTPDEMIKRIQGLLAVIDRKNTKIFELEKQTDTLENEQEEIDELQSQLAQARTELVNTPADSIKVSNIAIQNIKKAAIKQFNRSLAMALIELDYQSNLRKGDIVNFIMPHMKKLAFVLADEQVDKAKVLMVKSKTIYDTHLQGLEFKQGTQTAKERERANIDLLFKKQLPVTE